MLKKRLITAAFLIPIFVVLVLKLSSIQFAVLTGLFALIGAWEWSAFMGVSKPKLRGLCVIAIAVLCIVSLQINVLTTLGVAFVFWLIATILIISYPSASQTWGSSYVIRGFMGVLALIPTWVALNFLHASEGGPNIVLFLCVLIWGADSGAYFAGKLWGNHKLAPAVSPGKTREGLYGALAATLVIAALGLWLQKTPLNYWFDGMLLALVTVIFSVIGDLFESMLKRNVNLKDSGTLIPGHGGLLDRIDSLTAAAPIFALGAWLISKSL